MIGLNAPQSGKLPENAVKTYNRTLILIHWATALLIVAVFASIELREVFEKGSIPREFLKSLHSMLGLSVLALTLVRIFVALRTSEPAIYPAPPAWQALAGKLMHFAIYAILIALPVLGWLTLSAAGKPVPAEVAVGVVDEALYALRADATPKSHDVFYGRIADAVTTVAAFPVLFYGGAGKGDAGNVRRDFRDVAAWAPDVRTGTDGRAQIELKWPDNLTTWRATARGVSDATLVGESVAKTLVSKDVVARLAVPRLAGRRNQRRHACRALVDARR